MNLPKLSRAISNILQTIDFSASVPGFRPYPFALYTASQICIDGTCMPYREEFLGNTAIPWQGSYLAIWNLEDDPVTDPELLSYSLVHEMFHCHQFANGERRFPSDLAMLTLASEAFYQMQHEENLALADAYTQCDGAAFARFVALRSARATRQPELFAQQLRTETIEGMAEYAGLCALRRINEEKYREMVAKTCEALRAESPLLFDARRICYFSGALFFLCLARLGIPLKNDLRSTESAYAQSIAAFSSANEPCPAPAGRFAVDASADIPRAAWITPALAALRAAREKTVFDFLQGPSIIRFPPPFAGMTLCTCSVSKTLYTAIISSFCRETARSCSFSAPRCCICERAMRSISTVIPLPRSGHEHSSPLSVNDRFSPFSSSLPKHSHT